MLPTLLKLNKLLLFTLAVCATLSAQANPQGGVVTGGSASISSSGNTTTINQSSQQAIVNWNSFNIANGEKTQFNQPANGVALNRINPNMGASQIYGQLDANGRIILVNAAGIHFGASANVNVGSIIASTSDISNRNFRHGNYVFDRPSNLAGSIVNEGKITTADYGLAALLGTSVLNTGVIRANLGSIALGAGSKFTLSFTGDNLINFEVNGAASTAGVDSAGNKLKNGVSNTGKLISNGGQILVTANMAANVIDNVIDMSGIAEARSVHQAAGEIILSGGSGNVLVSGILNASGRHHFSVGGLIEVLGKNIELTSTAVVDAVGATGGGNVYIGGNEHGTGPLPDASKTTVDAGAVINASAINSGNGGNVIVWSNDLTTFSGTILAKGGAVSGNGGFSEISGHELLNYSGGEVNLLADNGIGGTLLLDPESVTISSGSTTGSFSGGNPNTYSSTSTSSVLSVTDLQNALSTANVNVTTGTAGDGIAGLGDITVNSPITWSSANTLTLTAINNIYLNSPITATAGGLSLSAAGNSSSNIGSITSTSSSTGVTVAINVGTFNLLRGIWDQVSPTLPGFSATNFEIASGALPASTNTQFTRATNSSTTNIGTSSNPYQITDIYGLQGIGSNATTLSQSYILVNDINASGTSTWSNSYFNGFNPLATSTSFSGTLNGNYYEVTNLYSAENSNYDYSIGFISNFSGTVQNLGLVNVNFTTSQGYSYPPAGVGGFIGQQSGGSVSNSYVTGNVTDNAYSYSGGFVGSATAGTISNSVSTVNLNNSGGDAVETGGFVGQLGQGGQGGPTFSNDVSMGTVNGGSTSGGFVGLLGQSGTVIDSYSTTPGTSGGFVSASYGVLTSDFWDTSTSGNTGSAGGTGGCLGCSTNLGLQSTYTGWNFSTTWGITTGNYPYLKTLLTRAEGTIPGNVSGATVSIYTNGSLAGTATTNSSGAFSYLLSGGYGPGIGLVYAVTAGSTVSNGISVTSFVGNSITTLTPNTVQIGDGSTSTISDASIASAIGSVSSSTILFSISGNTLTLGNGGATSTINLVTTPTTTYSMGVVNFSNATGSLSFAGPVTLINNASLTASAITFANTVNGGGTYSLSMNSSANSITGAVSNITSLTLSGAGSDTLSASITSSGAQLYNDNLTLSGSETLTTTNSNITFMGTVNGAASLTLAPGTGAVSFDGAIGTTQALTSLSNNGSGVTTIANGAGSSTSLLGSINLAGAASLGGAFYTSGTQTYSGTTTLTSNTSLTASSNTLHNIIGNGNTLALNSGTISGVFSDGTSASSLDQDGTGTLTLSGANTFSGATTVTGILSFSGSGSLADSTVTLANTAASQMKLNNLSVAVGGIAGGGATGGNILLGSGTLTINNASANTYAGVVSGTGGLTQSGAGTLTLSGANTYSGGTKIGAGTLVAGSATSLGTGNIEFSGNSTLESSAAFVLTNTYSVDSSVTATISGSSGDNIALGAGTLNAATSIVNITNAGTTSLGALQGAAAGDGQINSTGVGVGAITLAAVGTSHSLASVDIVNGVTLNGSVTTSGAQTLSGAVALGAADTFTSTGSGAIQLGTVTNGGNGLTISSASASNTISSLSGTGGLTQSGAGTLTLSGANSYSGGTKIGAGTLVVGSATSLGTGNIEFSGNSTLESSAAFVLTNTYSVDSSVTATISGSSGDNIALGAGTLNAATSIVNITNAGTTSLGALQGAAAGDGQINSTGVGVGAITLAAVGTSNSLASVDIVNGVTLNGSVTTSGAQTFSGAVTLGAADTFTSTGSGAIQLGTVTNGGNGLTLSSGSASNTISSLSGTGGLTQSGAGTLTLSGANTYSGGTKIGAGTLVAGSATSLGTGNIEFSGNSTLESSAAFVLTNTYSVDSSVTATISGSSGDNIALGAGTLNAATSIVNITNAGTTSLGALQGAAAGDGQINSTGVGVGAITLAAVGTSHSLASVDIVNGVTLNGSVTTSGAQTLSGAVALGAADTFTSTGSGAIQLGTVTNGGNGLTISSASASNTISSLSGTGGLTQSGAGTLTLSGANSYSGGTKIGAGTLVVGSATSLGTGNIEFSGNSTLESSAAFVLTNTYSVDSSVTATISGSSGDNIALGAGTLNAATSIVNITNAGTTSLGALQGAAAGDGQINSTGVGVGAITLAAVGTSNSLASVDIVNGVTLNGSVTTSGAQTFSGAVTLGAADTFTSTGSSAIQLGTVTNGGNGLTISSGSASNTISSLSGTGGLTQSGAGTLTLSGANSYSGGTKISAGTLVVGSATALGTGNIEFSGNSTLESSAAFVLTNTYSVDSSVTATISGSSGDNIALGAGTLNAATSIVNITNAGTTSLGALQGAAAGDGQINSTGVGVGAITLAAVGTSNSLASVDIVNGVTLNGSVTTSGAQTFSGAVTLGAADTFTSTGSSAIQLGTVMNGGNGLTISSASASNTINSLSGTGGLTLSGSSNVLTLSNNNTFTGATTIDGGTLNLTSANALADSSGVNVAGGYLQLSNIAASIQSLTLSGGTLTGTGTSSTTVNVTVGASSSDTISTVNSADQLTLSGTINGSGSLSLQGAGKVVLSGAVGNTTKLSSITSTAGSTGINNNVSTTGNQTYNSAVVLGSGNIAISVANTASSIDFNAGVSGNSNLTLSGSANGSNSFILAGTLAVTGIVVNGGSGSNNFLTIQSNNAQTFNITASNVGNVTGANSGTLTFNSIQNLVGGAVSNDFVFANNTLIASINGTGNSNNKLDNSASSSSLSDTITADNTGTVQLGGSTMNFSHIQNLIGAGSSTLVVSESTPNEIVLTGRNNGYVNDPTNFNGFTTFTSSGSGATSVDFASTPSAVFSTSNSAYYINAELTFNNINSFSGNFTGVPQPAAPVSASVSVDQVVSFQNYISNVITSAMTSQNNNTTPLTGDSSLAGQTIVVVIVENNLGELVQQQASIDFISNQTTAIYPSCTTAK